MNGVLGYNSPMIRLQWAGYDEIRFGNVEVNVQEQLHKEEI